MSNHPTPVRILDALRAFEHTGALVAAIQLGVFSAIAAGKVTAPAIAGACSASERGTRILCDALTAFGMLTKSGDEYANTPDTAVFLVRNSPAYLGSAIDFLNHPEMMNGFLLTITDAVRKGGTLMPGEGTVEPENPLWVNFARAMGPLMAHPARMTTEFLPESGPLRVLDIAAGHGMFGIAIARKNREARITAVDWASVLEVAKENASIAGVSEQLELLPGSAFEVDFGAGYDLALVTNFLHHFDADTNASFLKRVHAALKPGGRVMTFEFVPDESRVTPPSAGRFALIMLASTARGDAYTFRELDGMFRAAGFGASTQKQLDMGQSVIITSK